MPPAYILDSLTNMTQDLAIVQGQSRTQEDFTKLLYIQQNEKRIDAKLLKKLMISEDKTQTPAPF